MAYKTPLRKAIEHLKDRSIINGQKDLLDFFQLKNASNLSKFIDSVRPNKELLSKFEEQFDIKLADFESNPSESDMKTDLKKIEATCHVILSAIAEILANQNGSSVTVVRGQLEKMVDDKLKS